ncbi:hypothetical protein [Nocardioides zeicaulis]|uniref:Uncharacterized protein n=1 Tax=Nocardioides zeicaulis TaxID=1776857 RepID=A0ABV6E1G1_9ACTN
MPKDQPSLIRSAEFADALERLLADPLDPELTGWLASRQSRFTVTPAGGPAHPRPVSDDLIGAPFRFFKIADGA